MTKKKKAIVITSSVAAGLALIILLGLILTGLYVGWGPFTYLNFDKQEKAILSKYDSTERQNEIVFYGASNFRLWTEMDNDLSEYKVQNHGFGGSTDKDLVERADKLLYPYNPQIVVLQTGSNDYVALSGTDAEKIASCMQYKRYMLELFHQHLPNAKFVIMSGLLLPGRSQYTDLTIKINEALRIMCEEYDYLTFVSAEKMTYDGQSYCTELFETDQIHLNRQGQILWCEKYIKPTIEKLITTLNRQSI